MNKLHASHFKSYSPHLVILVSIIIVATVILVQWQTQNQVPVVTQQPEPVVTVAPAPPVSLNQEEIAANVYALQAQPTQAPAYTIVYAGPTSASREIPLRQYDVLAVINTTPNDIRVTFSSGSSMTLGANQTLENTLSQLGKEVISIQEGVEITNLTVSVKPSL